MALWLQPCLIGRAEEDPDAAKCVDVHEAGSAAVIMGNLLLPSR